MAEYYSRADLTVIASRRETFSMVCAESLCCGTPVAGFEAGGPESIAIPEYSAFARYGDVEALLGCVKKLITVKRNEYIYGNIAEQAAKLYDTEIMADQYLKIYRQLTGEK
jgi:glycosyltransferase involved in cell wall biosynthesis